jgi:hypothetical protein
VVDPRIDLTQWPALSAAASAAHSLLYLIDPSMERTPRW